MLDLEPCIHSLGLQSVSKLQWGAVTISKRDSETTISYPLAFANRYLNGQVSLASTFGVASDAECAIFNANTRNATIRLGSDKGMDVNYWVVGF